MGRRVLRGVHSLVEPDSNPRPALAPDARSSQRPVSLSTETHSCPACGTPLAATPDACPRCGAAALLSHLGALRRPGPSDTLSLGAPSGAAPRVPLRLLTPAMAGHAPLARHVLGGAPARARPHAGAVRGDETGRPGRGPLSLVHSRREDTPLGEDGADMHTDDGQQASGRQAPGLEDLEALGPARPRGSSWVGLAVATLLLLGTGVWALLRHQDAAPAPAATEAQAAPAPAAPHIVPAAGHSGAPEVAPAALPQTRPAMPDTEDGK